MVAMMVITTNGKNKSVKDSASTRIEAPMKPKMPNQIKGKPRLENQLCREEIFFKETVTPSA